MAIYGYLLNGVVVLTDDANGKEVQENPQLEAPEGYVARYEWVETDSQIVQSWRLEPVEGTEQEAALRLTKLQFMSLPDEAAYEFRALADEWYVGAPYSSGQRVKYKGKLYKVLQGHVSQADWAPDAAPSLFSEILPGQDGNEPSDGSYAEWQQPGSTNGYSKGDLVMHNGKLWQSQVDNNIWEPGGAGVYENIWKELNEA